MTCKVKLIKTIEQLRSQKVTKASNKRGHESSELSQVMYKRKKWVQMVTLAGTGIIYTSRRYLLLIALKKRKFFPYRFQY